MTVDHRIEWDSGKRQTAQALAWIVIVLFPVGVPLGLFTLLYFNRNQIKQRQTRSGDSELEIVGTSNLTRANQSPNTISANLTSLPLSKPPLCLNLPNSYLSSSLQHLSLSSTTQHTGICRSSTS